MGGWVSGWMGGWVGGWVGGWLEYEFLKKTPSPNLDLSPSLGLPTLEFVNFYGGSVFYKPFLLSVS